ncbi:pyocin activator PrtN family protein [Paraburkholderia heleia]|uniref:pyocin activator PrtN family protein n=1 Tax=Paraburkholderia heleia TaxID=634127 RepID=UPI0005AA98EA|nr:pyocin activator PrtN family protein [Paraburkholderia heleia]
MKTLFLLMAQFDGRVLIPFEEVRAAFFPHLDADNLTRKLNRGEITLPVVRADRSTKTARSFYVHDLAEWIDTQRAIAVKERNQLCSLKDQEASD